MRKEKGMGMYELALFQGGGGGTLGSELCGCACVGGVEIEPMAREMVFHRQRSGHLPEFPIWDDIRTFRRDNPECAQYIATLRGFSDKLIITGGFPCQDISTAGKRVGLRGERSGLFFEMARVICEIRPRYIYLENSPALFAPGKTKFRLVEVVADLFGSERRVRDVDIELAGDGLAVLGTLAEMGYDVAWGVLGASEVGAWHQRKRIWIGGVLR